MPEEIEEASTLGLRPGEWPDTLVFDGATFKRGDVTFDKEGEVAHVKYQGVHVMRRLVVLND